MSATDALPEPLLALRVRRFFVVKGVDRDMGRLLSSILSNAGRRVTKSLCQDVNTASSSETLLEQRSLGSGELTDPSSKMEVPFP